MTKPAWPGARHPKIYAYSTPNNPGLLKVGYTERDVGTRIGEQVNPVKTPNPVPYTIEFTGSAVTTSGSVFTDKDVHRALRAMGRRNPDGEWFACTAADVRAAHEAVRDQRPPQRSNLDTFDPRPEQVAAVETTAAYYTRTARDGHRPHYLWNAKMRFGKTFAAYQLAKKMGWNRVLVLTYKPAVEQAWRDDLEQHRDFTGWRFKSGTDRTVPQLDDTSPLVWFASFQDVLGADSDGNPKPKNQLLYSTAWDIVIIDEYHFGAWRDAARDMYTSDRTEKELNTPDVGDDAVTAGDLETELLELDAKHYLYLSGTPFRALANGEFLEDQIFNWTYQDEQSAKHAWDGDPGQNPYAALPQMQMMLYRMPEKLREAATKDGGGFSLTEFFRTREDPGNGRQVFIHEQQVQKWLDLLRGYDLDQLWASTATTDRPPLPYEDTTLLRALQHTVWYLPDVGACTAMRDLLAAQHNTFYRDYTVVLAAGPGAGIGLKALPPVEEAIGPVPQDTKTITLTCAKLLTGVTVPPWSGIFMLRELSSPESYFQAAFRVQSPWTSQYHDTTIGGSGECIHKEVCYVFDFAPNRALQQVEQYAVKLRADVASKRDREQAVEEFIGFMPILSFDGNGMVPLDAGDVLDQLVSGITAGMLARRWNSPELITLNTDALIRILDDERLVAALEEVPQFRGIKDQMETVISADKKLKKRAARNQKFDDEEKRKKKERDENRKTIKQKLQWFIARLPVFMYLTDDREKTVKNIIEQIEPDLFRKVTGLTLEIFEKLVDLDMFHEKKMNDAVWSFRVFENPSLHYLEPDRRDGGGMGVTGGWDETRCNRFARMIDQGILSEGDVLMCGGTEGTVSNDYGIIVDGVRYMDPDTAAAAAGMPGVDGWSAWTTDAAGGEKETLQHIESVLWPEP